MMKDAFLRISGMGFGAQYLALFRGHGNGQVGEQCAVEIIHQLLIAHIFIVGETALWAETTFGRHYGLAYIAGVAIVVGRVYFPGSRHFVQW